MRVWFERLRAFTYSHREKPRAARHRLNSELSRHRKPRNRLPAVLAVFVTLIAGLNFTIPGLATSSACEASISDNPTGNPPGNNEADPLVLDSAGQQIGTDNVSLHGDDPRQDFELPFNLSAPTGSSVIQVSSNGHVNLTGEQVAINVFNADLDITTRGSLFTGACDLTWNGVTSPAYFVTWDDVSFLGNQDSHLTMQLIFVKTSRWSYSVIRNYSRLEASDAVDKTWAGYDCDFESDSDSCGTVVSESSNTDTSLGSLISELLQGGTSDLTQHHTTNTTQTGRYVYSRTTTVCDDSASGAMTVSYSQPGVQSVNPNFSATTENFDSFAAGNIATPVQTAVGLLEGDAVAFPADLYGGAGHIGNGFSANNATFTAPVGTCYKYLGFWWSAGSPNNAFQLLDENNNVLANFTAEDLYHNLARVPGQPTCPDALNDYCGNPNHDETSSWADDADEPFAYLNIRFPAGFKKIRMYVSYNAWGFELDNVSLATAVPSAENETFLSGDSSIIDNSSPSPSPSVSGGSHSISFHSNGQGALGAMTDQTESTSTSIDQNLFTRAGYSFNGWSTTPDGEVSYLNGDNFDFQSDLDLYAIWSLLRPVIAPYEITRSGNSFLPPTAQITNQVNAVGEGWFICDSPHSEFDLTDFPVDCSAQAGGGSPFAVSGIPEGKYLGYGFDAVNDVGHTFALKTISDFQLAPIWAHRTATQFFRDPITIYGRTTSVNQSWYRCTNPAVNPTALPSGCTDTGDYGLEYHPTFADLGKYMVYAATATDGVNTQTQIHDAGNIVTIQTLVGNWLINFTVSIDNILGQANHTASDVSPKATYFSGQWYACDYPQDQLNYNWPSGTTADVESFRSRALSDAACVAIPGATADSVPVDYANSGKFLAWAAVSANNDFEVFRMVSVQIPNAPTPPAPSPSPSPSVSSSSSPSPSSSPSASSSPSSTPVASTPAPSPSPSTPKPVSSPSVAPPSGSATPPKNAVSPAQAPSTTETPVTPAPQTTPSEAPTQEPQPGPAPAETEAPSAQLNAAALLGGVLAVLPDTVQQIFVAESNPAIGATGDDSAAPQPFEALATPASAQAFTENIGHVFTMVAGTALAGIAAAAASAAASAASASAAAASSASAASSSASTSSSGSKSSGNESAPGSVGISHDSFTSRRRRWGDELRIWKLRLMTAIDKISVNFVLKSAPISPLVARLFNDGTYLRAMFGTLTVVGPLAAMTLAINGSILGNGMIANSTWVILLIISALGSFDVLAGAFAMLAYALFFWFTNTHIDVLHDIRMLLGTALVVVGPAMAMTAFRSIRRKSARHFSEWWERFVDLAVGPFMAGWTASTFVSTLPAIAGVTLAVANHILLFALVAAGCAFIRVLAEEFAARNFPARLNALTPDAIPEPSMVQKYISLVIRYAFWVFMLMGVMDESWQLWIGSALIVLPSVLSWYKHKIPNSPTLWRIMPTGVPALAVGLLLTSWTTSALTALSVSAAFLAKWAFVILPLPLVAFGILALFARHGEDPWEVKPAKRNQFVYRAGGILMLALTMRLAGII